MITLVTAWIMHPALRVPPVKMQVTIKGNWAILPRGQRKLIGTTAFFTELAATRRWQGELDRTRKNNYIHRAMPSRWTTANDLCTVNVYKGRTS